MIYFLNSNVMFNNKINTAVIPYENDHVFVTHHGYNCKHYNECSYEKNNKSMAYVPYTCDPTYVGGGFFGATPANFIKMCDILNNNIMTDERHNYIAVWHDESHLNWYVNIYLQQNCSFLDISYHVPEELMNDFKTINIIYRQKDNIKLRNLITPHTKNTIYKNKYNEHLLDCGDRITQ